MAGAEAEADFIPVPEYVEDRAVWVYFKEAYTENIVCFCINFKDSIIDVMNNVKFSVKVWFNIDELDFDMVLSGLDEQEEAPSIIESCPNLNTSLRDYVESFDQDTDTCSFYIRRKNTLPHVNAEPNADANSNAEPTFHECPVCYEKHETNLQYHCDHSVCQKCFDVWKNRANTCPCCRAVEKNQQQPPAATFDIESNFVRYYEYNINTAFNRMEQAMRQRDNALLQHINSLIEERTDVIQLNEELNNFRYNLLMGL